MEDVESTESVRISNGGEEGEFEGEEALAAAASILAASNASIRGRGRGRPEDAAEAELSNVIEEKVVVVGEDVCEWWRGWETREE